MTARKICVLGDFGVGKTSLTRRYVLNQFSDDYHATLGVNLYKFQDVALDEDGSDPVSLILWDIEGASAPARQSERYMLGASGAVIVGDAAAPRAEEPMARFAEAFERLAPGRPVIFAFNKIDLLEAPEAQLEAPIGALRRRFGGDMLLTSARTGDGVVAAFRSLISNVVKLGI